jgi:hypothetical protein
VRVGGVEVAPLNLVERPVFADDSVLQP